MVLSVLHRCLVTTVDLDKVKRYNHGSHYVKNVISRIEPFCQAMWNRKGLIEGSPGAEKYDHSVRETFAAAAFGSICLFVRFYLKHT